MSHKLVEFDKIPNELTSLNQWVTWKYVERDGKITKPPFNPATGYECDATDKRCWYKFNLIKRFAASYDGIGLAIQGSGLIGVDLDHCIVNGVILEWAQRIIDRLDSYTEITPSGDSVRIWIYGKLPEGRRRKGLIEMYDSGRYFTVTGNHLPGTRATVNQRQQQIELIHGEIFPKKEVKQKVSKSIVSNNLDDDEILKKAFANKTNGKKIEQLFNGDMSEFPDSSADGFDHSQADLSFCSRIAFWCAGDIDAIDRIFRRSGLMRDKWEREDYRNRTLQKSLEGTKFYNPRYFNESGRYEKIPLVSTVNDGSILDVNQSRCDGNNEDGENNGKNNGQDSGQDNGQDNHGREPGEDQREPDPEGIHHKTDLGNSRIFHLIHGNNVRYVSSWKSGSVGKGTAGKRTTWG